MACGRIKIGFFLCLVNLVIHNAMNVSPSVPPKIIGIIDANIS